MISCAEGETRPAFFLSIRGVCVLMLAAGVASCSSGDGGVVSQPPRGGGPDPAPAPVVRTIDEDVQGDVAGGSNNDTITLRSGTVSGDIMTGDGDDVVLLVGGSVGAVDLGAGDDRVEVAGNTVDDIDDQMAGIQAALNLREAIDGGAGRDAFRLVAGGKIRNLRFSGDDPSNGDVHLQNIEVISIDGGEAADNIVGGSGAETFEFASGVIGGYLDGGAGADSFTAADAAAGLAVRWSTDDSDTGGDLRLRNIETITLTDHADTFVLAADLPALGQSAVVDGGAGSDRFTLATGGVAGAIMASGSGVPGAGNLRLLNFEAIRLAGGEVTGNIVGGAGSDSFDISSGRIGGYLDGGGGADSFTAADAAAGLEVRWSIDDSDRQGDLRLRSIEEITLTDHADTFVLAASLPALGQSAVVDGGAGSDRFTLATGGVVGAILTSGSGAPGAGDLRLLNFEDIRLAGVEVTGNIVGGAGSDSFDISSGRIGGYLDGGGGADSFTAADAAAGLAVRWSTDNSDRQGDLRLRNIETITLTDHADGFELAADLPTLTQSGVIDGGAGSDRFTLATGGVAGAIMASGSGAPGAGNLRLLNFEDVRIAGGEVTGNIVGGAGGETFEFASGTIGGYLDGGAGADSFTAAEAASGLNVRWSTSNSDRQGDLRLRNIETITLSRFADTFVLAFDLPALGQDVINSVIDGGAGSDRFTLEAGGVTGAIMTSGSGDPGAGGGLRLLNFETIRIAGGEVTGNILGGDMDETFEFASGTANGYLDGGGGADSFTAADAAVGLNVRWSTANSDTQGDLRLRNIEEITLTRFVDTFTLAADLPTLTQSGVIDGGAGSDSFTLAAGGRINTLLAFGSGGPGPDNLRLRNFEMFRIAGGEVTGNIVGGAGGETFEFASGTVGGYIDGGAGADSFTAANAAAGLEVRWSTDDSDTGGDLRLRNIEDITLTGFADTFVLAVDLPMLGQSAVIDGGAGSDTFMLAAGGVVSAIMTSGSGDPGAGNLRLLNFEDISLSGVDVTGNVVGGAGSDSFDVSTGTIGGYLDGGAGVDSVTAADAVAGLEVRWSTDDSDTGGDLRLRNIETITLTDHADGFVLAADLPALTQSGVIDGGAGSDRFTLATGGVVGAIMASGSGVPGAGDLRLLNFEDIHLAGGEVTANIVGGAGDETFEFASGVIGGYLDGGGGADSFTAADAAVGLNVRWSTANSDTQGDLRLRNIEEITLTRFADTFTLAASLLTLGQSGVIDGGAGSDSFTLAAGGRINTLLAFGSGGAGPDNLRLLNFEMFRIAGGEVTGNIVGGEGDETFEFASGMIGGYLDGGEGVDSLFLNGVTATGIDLGPTAPAGNAFDARNIELLRLAGGTINGNILGSDGAERFVLGAGNTLDGYIDGGAGQDILELADGATVLGIAFSDTAPTGNRLHLQNIETIRIDGGMVTGDDTTCNDPSTGCNVVGSDGEDTFVLVSGDIDGDVRGGAGADRFSVFGDLTEDTGTLDFGVIDGGMDLEEDINNPGSEIESEIQSIDVFVLGTGGVAPEISFFVAGSPSSTLAGAIDLLGIERVVIDGGTVSEAITGNARAQDFRFISGEVGGDVLGNGGADRFFVFGDLTGAGPELVLGGVLDGGTGPQIDTFTLGEGGTAAGITFDAADTTPGVVRLRNIRNIRIGGGAVPGAITGGDGVQEVLFFSGEVGGDVLGGAGADEFTVFGDLTGVSPELVLSGVIDGGTDFDLDGVTPSATQSDDSFSINAGGVATAITFDTADTTPGVVRLRNIETVQVLGGEVLGPITGTDDGNEQFNLVGGIIGGDVRGGDGADSFFIVFGDTTEATPNLVLSGIIDGGAGDDTFSMNQGSVVAGITFDTADTTPGVVRLSNIETITIQFDGLVSGDITGGAESETFELLSGTVTGNVLGGAGDDTYILATAGVSGFRLDGYLDGGAGTDTLFYMGSDPSGVALSAGFGLTADTDIGDNLGSARNIESQERLPTTLVGNRLDGLGGAPGLGDAGFNSRRAGRVWEAVGSGGAGLAVGENFAALNFERLSLSPALSLYGLMGDALMAFGTQMAEGLAFAPAGSASPDALPQARLSVLTNPLLSQSDLVAGRAVWAHQISRKGRAQGDIGLAIRGLTPRAEGGYDYRTALTQQGLDSRLSEGRWGTLGLRLTAHALTGAIETQGAQALTRGYGAGLGLLWKNGALSATLTGLAGFYEVEASTNAVFSAFQSVLAASVIHRREFVPGLAMRMGGDLVWQGLSLDNPAEGGAAPLAAAFEDASRFAGRLEAGLESEHWFADLALVHETESGGALTSGLRQDYRSLDGTAFETRLGWRIADLLPGLSLEGQAALREPFSSAATDISARIGLSVKF